MTNKLKYFIGNWKMFGDFNSFKIINKINQYAKKHRSSKKTKIVLCVPNVLIDFFSKRLKKKTISIGAQNCYHEEGYGPFTGAVSAFMLKKMGAKYIILGHSENREEGETPKLIKKKIVSALNQKLNIILCVGEKFNDKKKGKTFSVIKNQIKGSIEKNFNKNKIILAYEPVWSIGTNKIPKTKELMNVISFIKNYFKKNFKSKKSPKVLYGGSVNKNNIKLLSSISEIDGFLVGGASQSSKKFIDIIKNYYK
ncbi:triose-phosphate isomerase [Pelagibacteraceae bacterium]|nr:triose-phosphate isomerase [Pelagibacteraceae bacterium]